MVQEWKNARKVTSLIISKEKNCGVVTAIVQKAGFQEAYKEWSIG